MTKIRQGTTLVNYRPKLDFSRVFLSAAAGVASPYFFARISGAYNTAGVKLAINSSNTIYAGCTMDDGDSSLSAYILVKFNSTNVNSTTLPQATFINSAVNLYSYALTSSGNLAGNTEFGSFQINSSGALSSAYYVPGVGLRTYLVDASSNQYFGGQTFDLRTGGGYNQLIIKTDSSGNLLWKNSYGASATGIGWNGEISLSPSGNLYLRGGMNGQYITKINSSGAVVWSKTFTDNAGTFSVAFDSSENAFFTTKDNVTKIDASGNKVWEKVFAGCWVTAMGTDSSGNVYVGLWGASIGGKYYLAKLTSSGTQIWVRKFSVSSQYYGSNFEIDAIKINNAGDVVLGSSVSGGLGFYVATLPPDGSKTGTYTIDAQSVITYSADTLVITDGSTTLTAHTPVVQATALTTAAGTYTTSTVDNSFYKVVV
jgi:hypothetical protein